MEGYRTLGKVVGGGYFCAQLFSLTFRVACFRLQLFHSAAPPRRSLHYIIRSRLPKLKRLAAKMKRKKKP
ncbi:unnamed protein product [Cuscuta campestris]|uniref:Uncharacterized protein n=1 Tax=Cuscuta campestris TaxID=132261 RepID=A0A484LF59_9ASTE|nr:unnamed protein product [Cuscuta campestris]